MRFIENGPDIPDELLLALDEGRVVFFCGAGVSRARAGLPDFFGLAEQVLNTLKAAEGAPARKLLREVQTVEDRTGLSGVISADRIFGLLEREFFERDIERAVAKTLMPQNGVDLWAHEILLDLATSKEGITKLVTTNFDRLFDDCGRGLKTWQPPRLPDLAIPNDLKGIVYLHGRATEDYDGSENHRFVLSSAEFGRAYLSEGWATRFFKDVIDRYVVVFVGYTADDPPVQYLLEALNRSYGGLKGVYAFQPGDSEEASARWQHKGVSAIPYANKDKKHSALWETLEAWSERARDPGAWQKRTIELALNGPENLSPVQREHVARIVSTREGAQKFAESDPPAPANWLCVFDNEIRCGPPRVNREDKGREQFVDPFALFGLASDPAPANVSFKNQHTADDIPSDVWNAFAHNQRDRMDLRDGCMAQFRGTASLTSVQLPDRINHLGNWLARVSNQSASVWWAARQRGLHPDIQRRIRNNLERNDSNRTPHILQAWHYLFDHWRADKGFDEFEWYRFADEIASIGWTNNTIQKYELLTRPRMLVRHNYFNDQVIPPQRNAKIDLRRLLILNVVYTRCSDEIEVPDEWLADVVAARKRNLEVAIQIEIECGYYRWLNIPPIIPSNDPNISNYARTNGTTGAVLKYAKFFEKLLKIDLEQARREFVTWPADDYNIFLRLKIWASRFKNLVSNETFGVFFKQISQEAFWNPYHQRDLLLTLKERWAALPMSTTRLIEKRVLEGPKDNQEYDAGHRLAERNASEMASRLHWLHSNGCALNIDYDSEMKQLQSAAPKWKPEYGESADISLEGRSGSIHRDTGYSSLLDEPLSNILIKAQELFGYTDDIMVKRDPFTGLCENRPILTISVLRLEAKCGRFPRWAWLQFLGSQKRKSDCGRLKIFIAEILILAWDDALEEIIDLATYWILIASDNLPEKCVPTFERFVGRIIDFLYDNPTIGGSNILKNSRNPNWIDAALGSPAGRITRAILKRDPRGKYLTEEQGFPSDWCHLVERALALQGDDGRFALFFCTWNLNWLNYVDPEWTRNNVLSILNTDDRDTLEAWWAGYLEGYRDPPRNELFQTIKPYLLMRTSSQDYEKGGYCESLAGLVLGNWICSHQENGIERISNDEFCNILLDAGDRFRSQVLWHLEQWSKKNGGHSWRAHQERFLQEVWPIQRVTRTPESSVRLIELAFSSDYRFVDVSKIILPLLCPLELDCITLPFNEPNGRKIVDKHPERVLEILVRALPKNANRWPYKIDATLECLVIAEPALRSDTRWVELMRRWNSR